MGNEDKAQRSYIMSRVKHEGTKPEMLVRKHLFSQGFRYRVNDRRYPGAPDIVLPKWKTVIFVQGCFWHQHSGCKKANPPKSNLEYWEPKFKKNVSRDKENQRILREMGWQIILVWECELSTKKKREARLSALAEEIRSGKDHTDVWETACETLK